MSTFRPPLRKAYLDAVDLWKKRVAMGMGRGAAREAMLDARAALLRWRPTKMSDKGVAMLKREEGVVPYAYEDPVGWATFGVGHLITPMHKGITAADKRRWGTKDKPRRDLVDPTLRDDLAKYERAVREATGGKLRRQHQFDACVSLAFNIGIMGFRTSTVARKIREGRLGQAADAFLMWDNPAMLRPRRERERRLFLTGRYAV